MKREIAQIENLDAKKEMEKENSEEETVTPAVKDLKSETDNAADVPVNNDNVIEETKDLMKEIMTLDDEDLALIIGDKVTKRKLEV